MAEQQMIGPGAQHGYENLLISPYMVVSSQVFKFSWSAEGQSGLGS